MSLVVDGLLVAGVALELVGAGALAHSHNAESIVELRERVGEDEGTAMGQPDAISTHARLLAEKRVGFLLLCAGLLLTLVGLVADSAESVILMSAIGVGTIVVALLGTVVVVRALGVRYLAQARAARGQSDPDALPEQ